jgi:hypothetical protein
MKEAEKQFECSKVGSQPPDFGLFAHVLEIDHFHENPKKIAGQKKVLLKLKRAALSNAVVYSG